MTRSRATLAALVAVTAALPAAFALDLMVSPQTLRSDEVTLIWHKPDAHRTAD